MVIVLGAKSSQHQKGKKPTKKIKRKMRKQNQRSRKNNKIYHAVKVNVDIGELGSHSSSEEMPMSLGIEN